MRTRGPYLSKPFGLPRESKRNGSVPEFDIATNFRHSWKCGCYVVLDGSEFRVKSLDILITVACKLF